MSGKNKFFFEEDPETLGASGVSDEEQADIFSSVVAETGIKSDLGSMAPMIAEPIPINMDAIVTPLLTVDFGTTGEDYVIHITPTNKLKNLSDDKKLHKAISAIMIALNEVVPIELQVMIHPPQADWEVKALSFVIKGGAVAWNLDQKVLNTVTAQKIHADVSEICMLR